MAIYAKIIFPDRSSDNQTFDVFPMVADTIIVPERGVLRVVERGWFCTTPQKTEGFIIVEEIEGEHTAPSGRYSWH